jgi:hypothetical protein
MWIVLLSKEWLQNQHWYYKSTRLTSYPNGADIHKWCCLISGLLSLGRAYPINLYVLSRNEEGILQTSMYYPGLNDEGIL